MLDVFPQSADLNSMYADMQYFLRGDVFKAHHHYKIALEADADHVPAACGLATTMLELKMNSTGTLQRDETQTKRTGGVGTTGAIHIQ